METSFTYPYPSGDEFSYPSNLRGYGESPWVKYFTHFISLGNFHGDFAGMGNPCGEIFFPNPLSIGDPRGDIQKKNCNK
ncbi:hypothetical protein Syun_012392 [Stephania yunnanensis]|uniref:Uncharacterized protein n=1 Tax=Stephania yunnanensis TaxID=152371 RepID=A0AAP0JZG4_9MAGN